MTDNNIVAGFGIFLEWRVASRMMCRCLSTMLRCKAIALWDHDMVRACLLWEASY